MAARQMDREIQEGAVSELAGVFGPLPAVRWPP